jgi:hypothetical protein
VVFRNLLLHLFVFFIVVIVTLFLLAASARRCGGPTQGYAANRHGYRGRLGRT